MLWNTNAPIQGKFQRWSSSSKLKVKMSKFKVPTYKGLVTRNIHMKYKSPITYQSKDMANDKVFGKRVKLQGQGHKVKSYDTNGKVLS
jgi:hypothetical protein